MSSLLLNDQHISVSVFNRRVFTEHLEIIKWPFYMYSIISKYSSIFTNIRFSITDSRKHVNSPKIKYQCSGERISRLDKYFLCPNQMVFVSKSFPLSPRFNCFLKSIMGRHGLQSILYLSGFLLELDQVKWEKCSHSHNSSVFIFAACICPFATWSSELRRMKLFFEALSERNSWTDAIYDKSTKRRNHVLWKCGLSCL